MDHGYIDDRLVAERYLGHTLSARERLEFEAHLVDCQECTDRLLLAEMFHHRNGGSKEKPALPVQPPPRQAEGLRIRITRWQLFLILVAGAALLALVTSSVWLWVR